MLDLDKTTVSIPVFQGGPGFWQNVSVDINPHTASLSLVNL